VGLTVIDAPVLASGRLELRWYVREQTVSQVLHRYGSVTGDGSSASIGRL
jgi:RHH-type proline utilization regulon transcriptional repressor/proline dehydrogenase/delta 1-pyrroline-5-carboxylate dehydrogenase